MEDYTNMTLPEVFRKAASVLRETTQRVEKLEKESFEATASMKRASVSLKLRESIGITEPDSVVDALVSGGRTMDEVEAAAEIVAQGDFFRVPKEASASSADASTQRFIDTILGE